MQSSPFPPAAQVDFFSSRGLIIQKTGFWKMHTSLLTGFE